MQHSRSCSQPCQEQSPHTSRQTIDPEPQPCNHPREKLAPPTSGPALAQGPTTQGSAARSLIIQLYPPVVSSLCTKQGLATNQTKGKLCLPDHPQLSAHQNRGTHTAHIVATTGAYSSGDQRKVCCWDALNVSYKRPLLQGQEV